MIGKHLYFFCQLPQSDQVSYPAMYPINTMVISTVACSATVSKIPAFFSWRRTPPETTRDAALTHPYMTVHA